ncbi:hypothetical protein K4K53_013191 [Colletotrichum sp. SAR 10_77]|nr:hypothetical protein K4K53_013191 [Colletotrichum sp. SAR 10_77]
MISPFSPLPNYILGTGLTFVGLLGFVKPLAVYDAFGIARPLSPDQPAEPFSYAKAGRDLATGLLFILLETYQEGSGNEDAVTMLWATTALVVAGAIDEDRRASPQTLHPSHKYLKKNAPTFTCQKK